MRVRFATRKDRTGIVRLCRRAVGSDDYVLVVLNGTLRRGGLAVAVEAGRIAGMADSSPCLDNSMWFAMARTDPDYRRRGVNTAVIEFLVEEARARGHSALRLWSNASNAAGCGSARANGFLEVGRFVGLLAKPRRGAPSFHPVPDPSEAWRRTRDSAVLRAGNGYVHLHWYFVKWSREVCRRLVAAGEVHGDARGLFVSAPDTRFPEFDWYEFSALDRPAAVLREARRITAQRHRDRGFTYLPRHYRGIAAREGYRTVSWGDDVVLFERRL